VSFSGPLCLSLRHTGKPRIPHTATAKEAVCDLLAAQPCRSPPLSSPYRSTLFLLPFPLFPPRSRRMFDFTAFMLFLVRSDSFSCSSFARVDADPAHPSPMNHGAHPTNLDLSRHVLLSIGEDFIDLFARFYDSCSGLNTLPSFLFPLGVLSLAVPLLKWSSVPDQLFWTILYLVFPRNLCVFSLSVGFPDPLLTPSAW